MIKLWKHKYTLLTYDREPIRFAANPEQFDIFYQFTTTDLEQFAKKCFEAAMIINPESDRGGFLYPNFADFWAEQKEKLGK